MMQYWNRKRLRKLLFNYPWAIDLYEDYLKKGIDECLIKKLEQCFGETEIAAVKMMKYRLQLLKIDADCSNSGISRMGIGIAILSILVAIFVSLDSLFEAKELLGFLTIVTVVLGLLYCILFMESKLWRYIDLLEVFAELRLEKRQNYRFFNRFFK